MSARPSATERAGEILQTHIGLRLEPSLRSRLERALNDVAALAEQSPDQFVASLARDRSALQDLCDRVTVQESGFFRHAEQFDVLTRHILATLTPPVRIWSAACGNGQEPYSLAMLLVELGIEGRVMATDVSAAAVRRTERGRYSERELTGLSPARRVAHGVTQGSSWSVNSDVRRRVDAGVRNLLQPLADAVATCQIVFCRNVLIYFTPEHANAFLDRLADCLPPGAHLFLGGAESIWHITDRFEPLQFGSTFVYRVRSDRPPSRASVAAPLRRRPRAPSRIRRITDPPIATAADDLARRGREALVAGDDASAVRSLRMWTYLEPDNVLAQFHLAVALDSSGDAPAAARAFSATSHLVQRRPDNGALVDFGGYALADVLRLLDTKKDAF
jgi:chemotaxis protein methyltransferase CheR